MGKILQKFKKEWYEEIPKKCLQIFEEFWEIFPLKLYRSGRGLSPVFVFGLRESND